MRIEPNSEQRRFIDESMRVHHYVYNALITAVKLHFSNYGRLPSRNDLNRICTTIWQNNPSVISFSSKNWFEWGRGESLQSPIL